MSRLPALLRLRSPTAFVTVLLLFCTGVQAEPIVGIAWGNTANPSELVTFDSETGLIVGHHEVLWDDKPRGQNFVGLTYDRNHDLLYAWSQVEHNLYAINPDTSERTLLGSIDVRANLGGTSTQLRTADVGGLAYNTAADILYGTIVSGILGSDSGWRSQLITVDPANGAVAVVATLPGLVNSLAYNQIDGGLYAYATGETWTQSDRPRVIRIDPLTGAVSDLFTAPYHTVLGLALDPGSNSAYSWVNALGGPFYTHIDLATGAYYGKATLRHKFSPRWSFETSTWEPTYRQSASLKPRPSRWSPRGLPCYRASRGRSFLRASVPPCQRWNTLPEQT
jgi:hypothetical protein